MGRAGNRLNERRGSGAFVEAGLVADAREGSLDDGGGAGGDGGW